jgi:hypothetical protein
LIPSIYEDGRQQQKPSRATTAIAMAENQTFSHELEVSSQDPGCLQMLLRQGQWTVRKLHSISLSMDGFINLKRVKIKSSCLERALQDQLVHTELFHRLLLESVS